MNRKIFCSVSVFVLLAMLVLCIGPVQAQTPGGVINAVERLEQRNPASGVLDACQYETLNEAIADAGTSVLTLQIACPLPVTQHVTQPSTLTFQFLPPGQLIASSAVTVTVQGPWIAPKVPVVGTNVTVTFADDSPAPSTLYPEWWGAVPDNSPDDDGDDIQAMLTAGKAGSIYEFSAGTYYIATALTINKSGHIKGTGKGGITLGGTKLLWTGRASVLLTLQDDARPFLLENFTMDNIGAGTMAIEYRNTTAQTRTVNVEINGTKSWATAGASTRTDQIVTFLEFQNFDIRSIGNQNVAPIGLRLARGQVFSLINCYLSGNLADRAVAVGLQLGDGTEFATGVTILGGKIEAFGIGIDARALQSFTIEGMSFNMSDVGIGPDHVAIKAGKLYAGVIAGNYLDGGGGGVQRYAWQFTDADVGGVKFVGNRYVSIGQADDTLGVFNFVGDVEPNFDNSQDGGYYSSADIQAMVYTLTPNSATPNVGPGNYFETQNDYATIITAFEPFWSTPNARAGKRFTIRVNDANTTLSCSSASQLKCNRGRPLKLNLGDFLECTQIPRANFVTCQHIAG